MASPGLRDAVRAHRQWPATIFSSLHGYKASFVGVDALAAVTLLVIAVPEQLATSRLAGMPPITAFYAFIAGTVLIAMLGSNPQMSVGADSTIAPLFAVGIAHLALPDSSHYIDLVGILAVLVGVIVALVGLLRLGWIAEFLSAPIITGFLAGVAVIIVVHQLPDLFGLPSTSGSTLHRIGFAWRTPRPDQRLGARHRSRHLRCRSCRQTHRPQVPRRARRTGRLHRRRRRLRPPAHGVSVLGRFAHGAPRFGLVGLSWSALGSVAPIAGSGRAGRPRPVGRDESRLRRRRRL